MKSVNLFLLILIIFATLLFKNVNAKNNKIIKYAMSLEQSFYWVPNNFSFLMEERGIKTILSKNYEEADFFIFSASNFYSTGLETAILSINSTFGMTFNKDDILQNKPPYNKCFSFFKEINLKSRVFLFFEEIENNGYNLGDQHICLFQAIEKVKLGASK